jgi:hypothetical protein
LGQVVWAGSKMLLVQNTMKLCQWPVAWTLLEKKSHGYNVWWRMWKCCGTTCALAPKLVSEDFPATSGSLSYGTTLPRAISRGNQWHVFLLPLVEPFRLPIVDEPEKEFKRQGLINAAWTLTIPSFLWGPIPNVSQGTRNPSSKRDFQIADLGKDFLGRHPSKPRKLLPSNQQGALEKHFVFFWYFFLGPQKHPKNQVHSSNIPSLWLEFRVSMLATCYRLCAELPHGMPRMAI